MTDAARVLLTAVVLSVVALTATTIRLLRSPIGTPARLVGQLHLSQWAALVLAAQGAISIGLAVASQGMAGAAFELAGGVVFVCIAAAVLRSEPPVALALAAFALGVHAAVAFAHRPGWWYADLAPFWFWTGQAVYDVYVATLCLLGAPSRTAR